MTRTKTIAIAAGSFIFIGLTAISANQYFTINDQGKTIDRHVKEIVYLENTLEEETSLRIIAEDLNISYEAKIAELRDSVSTLKSSVSKLRRKIKKQDSSLKKLSGKLAKIEQSYTAMKKEIAELSRKDQLDQTRIDELEKEKVMLRQNVAQIEQTKVKIEAEKVQYEQDALEIQLEQARLERISNIIDNTRVVYQNISIQKDRFGKKISKIGKRNSKWAYTILEFQLIHDDHQLLLDESFMVKIINAETNEILSYVESNPNFPESDRDTKGVQFKFDGNLIEIAHFNNQKKNGKNFEAQIFYVDQNGQEHLLRGGIKTFIKDRKLAKS